MKIAIGNDHVGVELKQHLVQYLEAKGFEVVNFGTDTTASTDYPIYAERVSKAVVSGSASLLFPNSFIVFSPLTRYAGSGDT